MVRTSSAASRRAPDSTAASSSALASSAVSPATARARGVLGLGGRRSASRSASSSRARASSSSLVRGELGGVALQLGGAGVEPVLAARPGGPRSRRGARPVRPGRCAGAQILGELLGLGRPAAAGLGEQLRRPARGPRRSSRSAWLRASRPRRRRRAAGWPRRRPRPRGASLGLGLRGLPQRAGLGRALRRCLGRDGVGVDRGLRAPLGRGAAGVGEHEEQTQDEGRPDRRVPDPGHRAPPAVGPAGGTWCGQEHRTQNTSGVHAAGRRVCGARSIGLDPGGAGRAFGSFGSGGSGYLAAPVPCAHGAAVFGRYSWCNDIMNAGGQIK